MVCYDRIIFVNLESEGAKKSKYWENHFKVVQMKFLAMHITNQKLRFDIFTVRNLLNIFMEHNLTNILMIFGIKKMYNFDSIHVLLAIATNIPVLLMTAFVLQGHIYVNIYSNISGESSVVTCGPVYPGFGLRRVN